jgi:hypothetical protein
MNRMNYPPLTGLFKTRPEATPQTMNNELSTMNVLPPAAHFLCKTNPMSSHAKMSLSTYHTKDYGLIGHLVNGKSKPKQTQSNPIFKLPAPARLPKTSARTKCTFYAKRTQFSKCEMSLTLYTKRHYAKLDTCSHAKNEPKTNPNEPNFQQPDTANRLDGVS